MQINSSTQFRYAPNMTMNAFNLAADDPEPFYTMGMNAWIVLNGSINNYLQGSGNFYVKSFTIGQTRNQVLSWSMEILDNNGTLSPHATGVWSGILNTSPFNSAGNINKTVSVQIQVQDANGNLFSHTHSGLVIRNREFEATPTGYKFTISGTDIIGLLLSRRDVTLSSYISKTGKVNMASTILKDLFAYLGITSYVLNFDDYPVRQLHVQSEKGIDVVNKLLWIPDAIWYSDGNTFYAEQISIAPSTYDFSYNGGTNVFMLREQEQAPSDFFNEVTIIIPEVSVVSTSLKSGDKYGRYEATFDPPILAQPSWQWITNQGGDITEMDCFDINGNWVGHFEYGSQTALGSTPNVVPVNMPVMIQSTTQPGAPIASIEFNYAPPLNSTLTPLQDFTSYVTKPHFQIFFYGISAMRPDLMPYIPGGIGNFTIPSGFVSAQINYNNIVNVAIQLARAAIVNPNNPVVINNPAIPTLGDLQQYLKLGVTVTDAQSVSANGPWPAVKPISNMSIPNTAWAYRVGVEQLIEHSRNKNRVQIDCPYNPFVRPGTNLNLVESVSNIKGIYQTESWQSTFEAGSKAGSSFTASNYTIGS